MSEYQCVSHDAFVQHVLSDHPEFWLACEHPERKPDTNMCAAEQCDKCSMMVEAGKRIGHVPNSRITVETQGSPLGVLGDILRTLFGDA
jgi:hypothetical protein